MMSKYRMANDRRRKFDDFDAFRAATRTAITKEQSKLNRTQTWSDRRRIEIMIARRGAFRARRFVSRRFGTANVLESIKIAKSCSAYRDLDTADVESALLKSASSIAANSPVLDVGFASPANKGFSTLVLQLLTRNVCSIDRSTSDSSNTKRRLSLFSRFFSQTLN